KHFRDRADSMTGLSDADHTPRQAAHDLKKLRAKDLITKIGRSRRYELSTPTIACITALLVLREHVIGPLLAGVQSPPRASKPTTGTATDRHYDQLQRDMQPLFHELGIAA